MFGSYSRLACVAVASASAVPALADLRALVSIVVSQLNGPAHGTDFLNLYAGAYLVSHDPSHAYDLSVQLAVQQAATGWQSPIVPFFLPPYAALLVGWLGWLPYGAAYLVWLAIGVGCVLRAAGVVGPRWGGGWAPPVGGWPGGVV